MTDTTGTAGTDTIVPIYEPEAPWKIWSIFEIWIGSTGTGRYVPKEDDWVVNPKTYEFQIVTAVDPITLIPTLMPFSPKGIASFSDSDLLLGSGDNSQADTYRVYVDKSVYPYTMRVDGRYIVPGSDITHAKLFRSADLTQTPISALYDTSGNFLTNSIPTQLASLDSHTNYAFQYIPMCYTTVNLVDGEMVLAVFYDDAAHVVSKRVLRVNITTFIKQANAAESYIAQINLESPFLSETQDHTLEFPVNVPITTMNLTGVVTYTSGEPTRYPVDGSKFVMMGLDQVIASTPGLKVPLVLKYFLGPNESAIHGVSGGGKFVTVGYDYVTVSKNNSYSVQLFAYPVWTGDITGYSLKWYLLNLDRNIVYDVTNLVEFNDTTGPFDPLRYGYLQRKSVKINLRDISAAFRPYIHLQLVDITLYGAPASHSIPWTVLAVSQAGMTPYSGGLFIKRNVSSPNVITLDSGISNYSDWLAKVYLATQPLVDRTLENSPPNPSHIEVILGTESQIITVGQWADPITFAVAPTLYSSGYLRFFTPGTPSDSNYSIAGMIVR